MAWHIVMHLFSALVDWFRIGRLEDHQKDLEILILRQQLGIAERKLHRPVRASRVERLTLAVLTTKLRSSANCTIEHRQSGTLALSVDRIHNVLQFSSTASRNRPQSPIIRLPEKREGSVQKRLVLGGIINDYYRMAA